VFGDGNPNQGIEEERWKLVLSVLCIWCFAAFYILYSFINALVLLALLDG